MRSPRPAALATAALLLALGAAAIAQPAQDRAPAPTSRPPAPPAEPAAPAPAQPGEPEDPGMGEAEIQQWIEAAKPTEKHRALEALAGTWDARIDIPGMGNFKGRQVNTMTLGGRFLQMRYEGEFLGERFEGTGMWGYNKTTEEYESTWSDTMSTNIMLSKGQGDDAGKVFTLTGEFKDPELGTVRSREVITVVDENSYRIEFHHEMAGQEMKVMEITYTRAKPGAAAPE